MLTSLAFVFLAGLAAAAVCSAIKLPRIIGMLLVGIVLGPHILNVLDGSILSISSELRQMALIIILLKAGLSLNLSDLRQVGRPAVLLSCLPATCELAGYILLAPYLLGVNRIEAAVMGPYSQLSLRPLSCRAWSFLWKIDGARTRAFPKCCWPVHRVTTSTLSYCSRPSLVSRREEMRERQTF